ncbi:hypothetical protein A5699_25950 [Mycobacterium sp. E802]|uniref:hypothetical protein n=1 Tax=Mycobacterium sp. E802 TaxID=1834152 RepID=UPI0007FC3AC0|nr:hypothetical protein [Mycobacterium sp. E802]OBG84774.1 hypothetical protein A5699_25950 [Mycobacterium sp. E802]
MKAFTVALIASAGFITWGLYFSDRASAGPLPICQYEDGNADGMPCMWTDPDTGRQFYMTSENYR